MHPSPDAVLLSSQVSPASSVPSPQTESGMQASPGVGQVKPGSVVQRAEHPSLPAPLSTKIFVKHVDGPLFFGSATGFQNILQKMPETLYVIIRLEKVPYIDQTGLYALEDSIIMLEKRGIEVLFVGLQPQPRQRLEAIHLIPDLILEGQLFDRFDDCVSYILRLENPNSKK